MYLMFLKLNLFPFFTSVNIFFCKLCFRLFGNSYFTSVEISFNIDMSGWGNLCNHGKNLQIIKDSYASSFSFYLQQTSCLKGTPNEECLKQKSIFIPTGALHNCKMSETH